MDDDDNDDNDDKNGNRGKGHNGNNGDSSNGRGEYCGANPPIIPRNLHPEVVYDQNEINEEVTNVDKHAAMGSITSMHVDEDALIRYVECAYNGSDEEPEDDDYNEVVNEHGEENRNAHGCNGDGNNRGEGGITSTTVGGNNDVASIASGDGGSSNVFQEEQTKEAPNQGVEIQDKPPPSGMNVNSEVSNVVILAMNNTNEEDNAPLNYIYTNAMQERMTSIGTILVGLDRLSSGTLRRPPRHRGSTVERSISGTSMTRNTNIG